MADSTQQTISDAFFKASGGYSGDADGMTVAMQTAQRSGETLASTLGSASKELENLSLSSRNQTDVINANIRTVTASSTAESASAQTGGNSLSILATVFKSALGMAPLAAGLVKLFGGGGTAEEPAPLTKYALPQSIGFQGADAMGGIQAVDYDQMGTPRAYGAPRFTAGGVAFSTRGDDSGAPASTGAAPQITVNVQAMDSRSFLDHSQQIAYAVRDAMLNLNALNDVVTEL